MRTFKLLTQIIILSLFPLIKSVATVTVAPGTSASLLPEGCSSASGYKLLQPDAWVDCPVSCQADCDISAGKATSELNIVNTIGYNYVTSTIYGQFQISDSGGTQAEVSVTLDYDIAWFGEWTLSGVGTNYNDAKAEVLVYLYDMSAGGRVVKKTEPPLHTATPRNLNVVPIPPEVGNSRDSGSTTNSFTLQLIRGHTYRMALTHHLTAKSLANAQISLDYISFPTFGLFWQNVTVRIAPDWSEQLAELTDRVNKLETEVAGLRNDLYNHRHTYLTGRGEGHNNTEAETSTAIIMQDSLLPDSVLSWLPDNDSNRVPLPEKSALLPNYPNPFNATTTIRFTLPEASPTKIVVYNLMGREVTRLVDGYLSSGEHRVTFDGTGLATGVYFYRLTTPKYVETRKLLMLK